MPIGWLYITYHLLREPETAIDQVSDEQNNWETPDVFDRDLAICPWRSLRCTPCNWRNACTRECKTPPTTDPGDRFCPGWFVRHIFISVHETMRPLCEWVKARSTSIYKTTMANIFAGTQLPWRFMQFFFLFKRRSVFRFATWGTRRNGWLPEALPLAGWEVGGPLDGHPRTDGSVVNRFHAPNWGCGTPSK